MSIRLEEINESNCEDCVKLRVASGQEKYLRPNGTAIAHWKFNPHWKALGIYEEDRMIGFAMYGTDSEDDTMNIISFMVDERYQGRGYGKAAMEKLMSLIQKEYCGKQIWVGVHPNNVEAQKLYNQFGFQRKHIDLEEEDEVFFLREIN